MFQLNWKGRPYRPAGGTGYIRVYKPDVNELLKPLSMKAGLGSAILTGNIVNPKNQPQVSPQPSPSVTPTQSVTPTLTPTQTVTPTPSITPTQTVTPSITPSVTPTEPYDIYSFQDCATSTKFRFQNVLGTLSVGEVYFISGSTSCIWNETTTQWEYTTNEWDDCPTVFSGYATVIAYEATGDVYNGNNVTFTLQPNCPGITPSVTPTMTVTPTPSITPTQTVTPSITPSITPSASPIPMDSDASAYLSAVVANGGTLNSTISAATNTLFTDLKSNSLYTKLSVMYPFLGGVANSARLNAKNTSQYNITWNGGMSFSSSGATGNGTNAYGNTSYSQLTFAQNDIGVGIYQLTSNTPAKNDELLIGSVNGTVLPVVQIGTKVPSAANRWFARAGSMTNITGTSLSQTGIFVVSKTGATNSEFYWNGNYQLSGVTNYTKGSVNNYPLYVFTINVANAPYATGYANQTLGFAFISSGLNGSEVSTLSNIINTWATSIGRNTY